MASRRTNYWNPRAAGVLHSTISSLTLSFPCMSPSHCLVCFPSQSVPLGVYIPTGIYRNGALGAPTAAHQGRWQDKMKMGKLQRGYARTHSLLEVAVFTPYYLGHKRKLGMLLFLREWLEEGIKSWTEISLLQFGPQPRRINPDMDRNRCVSWVATTRGQWHPVMIRRCLA